jgi:hypothetical protein
LNKVQPPIYLLFLSSSYPKTLPLVLFFKTESDQITSKSCPQHTGRLNFPVMQPLFCPLLEWRFASVQIPQHRVVNTFEFAQTINHLVVDLATGQGNPRAVRVRTRDTVQFSSRTVQKPNPQRLGRPNPDLYPSTHWFCLVRLDPSVPISGSVFRAFLFMVPFRYPTVNRKI